MRCRGLRAKNGSTDGGAAMQLVAETRGRSDWADHYRGAHRPAQGARPGKKMLFDTFDTGGRPVTGGNTGEQSNCG